MRNISLTIRQNSCNLKFSMAQKMIHRLLTQERIKTKLDGGRVINHHESGVRSEIKVKAYTKKKLAEKFGITSEELEKLKFPNFYHSIASKISLPLIRLYCATKFVV